MSTGMTHVKPDCFVQALSAVFELLEATPKTEADTIYR